MTNYRGYPWFKAIAIALVFSFITLDIAWAHPADGRAASSTLAVPDSFTNAPLRQSLENRSCLLAATLDIANYVFGDSIRAIRPLELDKLEAALTLQRSGMTALVRGIGLDKVVVIRESRKTSDNGTARMVERAKEVVLKDVNVGTDILCLPYTSNGRDFIIQVAARANPAAATMKGNEIAGVSDRFVVKVLWRDYKKQIPAASMPVGQGRGAAGAGTSQAAERRQERARRTLGDEVINIEGSRKKEILLRYATAAHVSPDSVVTAIDTFRVSEYGDGIFFIQGGPAASVDRYLTVDESSGQTQLYGPTADIAALMASRKASKARAAVSSGMGKKIATAVAIALVPALAMAEDGASSYVFGGFIDDHPVITFIIGLYAAIALVGSLIAAPDILIKYIKYRSVARLIKEKLGARGHYVNYFTIPEEQLKEGAEILKTQGDFDVEYIPAHQYAARSDISYGDAGYGTGEPAGIEAVSVPATLKVRPRGKKAGDVPQADARAGANAAPAEGLNRREFIGKATKTTLGMIVAGGLASLVSSCDDGGSTERAEGENLLEGVSFDHGDLPFTESGGVFRFNSGRGWRGGYIDTTAASNSSTCRYLNVTARSANGMSGSFAFELKQEHGYVLNRNIDVPADGRWRTYQLTLPEGSSFNYIAVRDPSVDIELSGVVLTNDALAYNRRQIGAGGSFAAKKIATAVLLALVPTIASAAGFWPGMTQEDSIVFAVLAICISLFSVIAISYIGFLVKTKCEARLQRRSLLREANSNDIRYWFDAACGTYDEARNIALTKISGVTDISALRELLELRYDYGSDKAIAARTIAISRLLEMNTGESIDLARQAIAGQRIFDRWLVPRDTANMLRLMLCPTITLTGAIENMDVITKILGWYVDIDYAGAGIVSSSHDTYHHDGLIEIARDRNAIRRAIDVEIPFMEDLDREISSFCRGVYRYHGRPSLSDMRSGARVIHNHEEARIAVSILRDVMWTEEKKEYDRDPSSGNTFDAALKGPYTRTIGYLIDVGSYLKNAGYLRRLIDEKLAKQGRIAETKAPQIAAVKASPEELTAKNRAMYKDPASFERVDTGNLAKALDEIIDIQASHGYPPNMKDPTTEKEEPYWTHAEGAVMAGSMLRKVYIKGREPFFRSTPREGARNKDCLLCISSRAEVDKGVMLSDEWEVKANIYPIFERHGMVISRDHKSQSLDAKSIRLAFDWARNGSPYRFYYNGIHAGATIPTHTHFQYFRNKEDRTLPIEELADNPNAREKLYEDGGAGVFLLKGFPSAAKPITVFLLEAKAGNEDAISQNTAKIVDILNKKGMDYDVMWSFDPSAGRYRVHLWPRPYEALGKETKDFVAKTAVTDFLSKDKDGNRTVSRVFAIVEFSGVMVGVDKAQYEATTADMLVTALNELGLPQGDRRLNEITAGLTGKELGREKGSDPSPNEAPVAPEQGVAAIASRAKQELGTHTSISHLEAFEIVESSVPKEMQALRAALRKLKPLAESDVPADVITKNIRKAQKRFGLSDEQARILRLALLWPGQGMGEDAGMSAGAAGWNLQKATEDVALIRKNLALMWDPDLEAVHNIAQAIMNGEIPMSPQVHADLLAGYNAYLAGNEQQRANSARYGLAPDERVVYFCMEYGLTNALNTYGGGLGILAGDHLRGISDRYSNNTFVGVGLAYNKGFFRQVMKEKGIMNVMEQTEEWPDAPISTYAETVTVKDAEGKEKDLVIRVEVPGGKYIYAKAWRVRVGRADLYLLDTEIPENDRADALPYSRAITNNLYMANEREWRFRQEYLLGIGGMRLLDELDIRPAALHINEGHAALAALELIQVELAKRAKARNLSPAEAADMRKNDPVRATSLGIGFEQALHAVKSKIGFTSHTPIPAGNEEFDPSLFYHYFHHYCTLYGLDIGVVMKLAVYPSAANGGVDMANLSKLAIALSADVSAEEAARPLGERAVITRNGVSRKGGEVSKKLYADESFGAITNSVHRRFWQSPVMQELLDSRWTALQQQGLVPQKKMELLTKEERAQYFRVLMDHVSNEELLQARRRMKEEAVRHLAGIRGITLDKDAFTIVVSRRFASYKRLGMILGIDDSKSVLNEDFEGQALDKLIQAAQDMGLKLQIVFAGKAHPQDNSPKGIIAKVNKAAAIDKWKDVIVFVPDYDIEVARDLLQIATVWENNPISPYEASGTSGEKAASNGVMSVSTPDGWGLEADPKSTVFLFGKEGHYEDIARMYDPEQRRELDRRDVKELEELYLGAWRDQGTDREKGIISMYRHHPDRWAERMRGTIYDFLTNFDMPRFIEEYEQKMYLPLVRSGQQVPATPQQREPKGSEMDEGSMREMLTEESRAAAKADPDVTELFEIVERAVNSQRSRMILNGNALQVLLARESLLPAGIGSDSMDKGMSAVAIRERIEDLVYAAGSVRHEDLPENIRGLAGRLMKDLPQLEADSIVASLIALGRSAKLNNEHIVIGLETDWIPGIERAGAGTPHDAMNKLMRQIDDLRGALQSMGLDNIIIIHEKKDRLADAVSAAVDTTQTKLSNVVILGGDSTLGAAAFDRFRSSPGDERAFLAAVNPALLRECAARCKESEVPNIRLMEMLCITLEVAAGKEPPRMPDLIDRYDKDRRMIVYVPKAAPVDWTRFRDRCDAQAMALHSA